MLSGLLRGAGAGAIVLAVVFTGSAVTQAAEPQSGNCPTVAKGSGAVTPPPAPNVDWSHCKLVGADLGGANLSGANLSDANLSEANLTDANTDSADFAKANLFDANAEGATLTNTNFTSTDMTFFMADDLAGSDLQGANLTEANFGSPETNFDQVRSGGITFTKGEPPLLPPNWTLDQGYLIGAGADFAGDDLAGWDLSSLNLSDTDLAGTNLTGADLSDDNLAGADVQGTIFKGVTWTYLESGDLEGTPASLPANWTLVGGYLIGPDANLTSAVLAKADLEGADLAGATLYLGTLAGANLTDANLRGAGLDDVDLTGVTWSNTICPDGTNSNSDGGTCVNNIDDTPPVASPTIDGRGGTNSWFTSPVTVVWNWTDGNATINPAKCPAKTTSTRQGSAVTVTGTCFNALGAEGIAKEIFKIDTTPPRVSVTGVTKNRVYALGHAPEPGCRTTDAVSGVATPATVKITVVGSGGTGIFTATCGGATDNAGNAAAPVSVRYTVAYGFTGFSSPKPGSKLAKSAPAISVRFRLANARGGLISAAAAAKLSREHRVQVTLTGPGISPATASCYWNGAARYFRCSIRTPAKVKAGKAYKLSAAENVAAGFVAAPVIGKAANPEVIYFK
jgi:uncharacterized protein YjbI with pentapeptide repeats